MDFIVFDRHYEGYDSWYDTQAGAFVDQVETQAAFELLAPQKGMAVLDVGCGTGNFSFKLAGLGCRVTGIDISENMLAQARAKGAPAHPPVLFERMDGGKLAFPDHSFDAVLSMAAFEFIHNPRQVYGEMKRVVRPGGVIVIGTIQRGGAWADLYSSAACARTAYAHAAFHSKEDLLALDPDQAWGVQECLYVPPGLEEGRYTLQEEERYRKENAPGGFVCVKFQKTGSSPAN